MLKDLSMQYSEYSHFLHWECLTLMSIRINQQFNADHANANS